MLSDRERETLCQVQRRFVTEDSRFAAAFNAVRPGASSCFVQWSYTLPIWAYTGERRSGVRCAHADGGAPGTALVFAALATAISLLGRRRDQTVRRDS